MMRDASQCMAEKVTAVAYTAHLISSLSVGFSIGLA